MGESIMSENVDVIRGLYDGFAAGDVPKVLAAMDPAIEWNEAENFPLSDRNPYVGPEAVAEGVFQRLADEWDGWSVDVGELVDAGDTVVMLGRYRATNKATGAPLDAQCVHVWRLREGKAVGFQQYVDTAQVQRAIAG
jgi:ketosteroid isomerase-like protein